MISIELARALRTAGLRWHPQSGDSFVVETADGSEQNAGEVFTVSEMTVEVHDHPGGQLIGFNGTTEWALDSVDVSDTLWLPREDQLRGVLRDGFRSLEREHVDGEPLHVVTAVIRGQERSYEAVTAEDAYGEAVLDLIVQSLVSDSPDSSDSE